METTAVNFRHFLVIPAFLLLCNWAGAQPLGEVAEPSPEELDAAFTEEDAAREAAAWSDVVIDRSRPDPLERMTSSADLVFRGAVASQEVVYYENDLPYTHTTLSITEVLKGSHPGSQITLVHEGGPAKDNPENIVMVSDARHFDEGENELLFVDVNPGESAPRKVSVEHRFRIYNGKVYDEHGHGVLLEPGEEGKGYRLGLSRDRNPAPRFSQIHIGPHTLTKNFGKEDSAPDSGGGEPQARRVVPGYQSSVDITTFSAAIRD
ncbi:MAG: hypothetical protein U5K56_20910 [Halioglobus sp.]|nr:hypothetical protein [Halioglobus sp.]